MIKARIAEIEAARLQRLKQQAPSAGANAMIVLLASHHMGIGSPRRRRC